MSNQHEALRLADEFKYWPPLFEDVQAAADELRRQHAEIEALKKALRQIPRLEAARSSAVATNEGLASTRATLAQQPKDHMSIESLDHIVSGAIFDFAGFLTTRSERITLSAADNAGPAADAVKAFLTLRGVDQSCEPFFQWPSRCSAVRPGGLVSPCGDPSDPLDLTIDKALAAAVPAVGSPLEFRG